MERRNYWNTTTVAPNGKWVSSVPDEVNYLIVGAGGAGMATAYSLALTNAVGITVIDPTLPVWRSARKQAGAVSVMPFMPTSLLEKGFSEAQVKELLDLGLWNAAASEKFMIDFGQGANWCEKESMGGFHIAFKHSEIDNLVKSMKYLKQFPMTPTLFDNSEVLQGITGLRNGHAGIFNPHDFVVNPARYLNGLTTAARYLGVDICSGFSIEKVEYHKPWWIVKDADGNQIKTRKLILCMGAFFNKISNFDEVANEFTRKRIHYIATKKLETRLPPYVLIDTSGKNIMRSHDSRVIYSLDDDDTEAQDFSVNSTTINAMKGRLTYRLHCAHDRELSPEFAWSRNVLYTPDLLPLITQFKSLPNIYLNMGYNEHSLSYQMIGGRIMAGLVRSGEYIIPGSKIFSFERMK